MQGGRGNEIEQRKAGYDEARYPHSELTGRIIGAAQRVQVQHLALSSVRLGALSSQLGAGLCRSPSAEIEELDVVQTLSYLPASGFEIALLLNFGRKELQIKRLIHSER